MAVNVGTRRMACQRASDDHRGQPGRSRPRHPEVAGAAVQKRHQLRAGARAGIAPSAWPKYDDVQWIGYAGGLGPHNLAEQMPRIAEAAGNSHYWVDMETWVRTDGKFDLALVRECIDIVKPYIVE